MKTPIMTDEEILDICKQIRAALHEHRSEVIASLAPEYQMGSYFGNDHAGGRFQADMTFRTVTGAHFMVTVHPVEVAYRSTPST